MTVFCGVPAAKAFSGFGNDITLMIIGTCVVGDALFYTGAADYIGKRLIALFGGNEKIFLMACIIISAALSAFLSNSATVAMMLPIVGAAVASSKGKLQKKHLYMPIGFAAVAGGGLTLVGSTPQLIAQGMILDAGLEGASFFEYFMTGFPRVLLMLLFFMTVGGKFMRKVCDFPEVQDAEPPQAASEEKFTFKMLVSVLIMVGCVLGFIFRLWTYGTVSMFCAALCFVTGCCSFKETFKELDWNTIVLLAAALGFAAALDESGTGELIANICVSALGANVKPIIVLILIAFLATMLGNMISASGATPILAPICLYMAPKFGMDPRSLVIAVVVFSSIVYSTPTSTPPNSMPMIAGYRFMDYVKVGGLLNLATVVMMIILFPMMYPLT